MIGEGKKKGGGKSARKRRVDTTTSTFSVDRNRTRCIIDTATDTLYEESTFDCISFGLFGFTSIESTMFLDCELWRFFFNLLYCVHNTV